MKKWKIEKLAEEAVLEGKSHQQIFNELAANTQVNVHTLAEVIRRVPTLEKRNRYRFLNQALVLLAGFLFLLRLGTLFGVVPDAFMEMRPFNLFGLLISGGMLYGLVFYKAHAHLIAVFYLLVHALWMMTKVVVTFDPLVLLACILLLLGTWGAAFLSSKFVSDYRFDKSIPGNDPELRENAIVFF